MSSLSPALSYCTVLMCVSDMRNLSSVISLTGALIHTVLMCGRSLERGARSRVSHTILYTPYTILRGTAREKTRLSYMRLDLTRCTGTATIQAPVYTAVRVTATTVARALRSNVGRNSESYIFGLIS